MLIGVFICNGLSYRQNKITSSIIYSYKKKKGAIATKGFGIFNKAMPN